MLKLVKCGQETGGTPLGRRGKLALQREAAAAEAAAEARTRSKREREADAARGPPPDPARSFRLPQPLLPDLLTVWELLQIMAPVLQAGFIPRAIPLSKTISTARLCFLGHDIVTHQYV